GNGAGGSSGGNSANGGATGNGGDSGSGGSTGTGGTPMKMACASATSDPLPYTSGYTADPANHSMAMSIATAMTSDEKAQQMSGLPQSGTANYNVFNQETNTSRNIRGFYYRDGPRGVNLNATADGQSDFSTAFPVAIARGAAFDPDLEYQVGEAIGDEMLASGNTMLLAPTVNILRHPAWGRAQETYGEDVFLLGRLGSAFVAGVQQYTGACAKHYAANNIEDGRETANATMDEETLREIYARHYEMIVQEGGVSSIMASYNEVNGTHSTQNGHLLTDLLRTDFGFQGFVLSDWWAMPNGNSVPYPAASTLQPIAQQAVNAGLDMELPWRYNYSTLTALVNSGGLQSTQLTTSAARILEQKYRFHADKTSGYGLKTPFTNYSGGSIQKNDQTDPVLGMSHVALAEQTAEESMVLLKNDNNTLPINPATVHKVAVIGANVSYTLQETNSQDNCSSGASGMINCNLDFTTNVRTGDNGSSRVFSDPSKSAGPFAGIMAASNGVTVTRYNSASAAQADGFDLAVVIAGLTPQDEGEEYTGAGDRTTGGISSTSHSVNFGLDPKANTGVQNGLITSVAALGKPTVVVLEGGSIIDMPWLSSVQAVVMAWYPGMAGGTALGRLLFGTVNFSGKLPLTWDTNASHWPAFASSSGTTQMDYWLGYRYFDHNNETPQFSFGYGLSYTTYKYALDSSVPLVGCSTVPANGTVPVTVDVFNNSAVAGTETVFVFVQYPGSSVSNRAGSTYKELKAFKRVPLAPNQGARVTIPLRVKDLKYWNGGATGSWAVESGMVKVIVAPSAAAATMPCTGGSGTGCALSDTFMVTQ
ncbi:MAG TPA: glycoside hydrolase family 3 N-terminal domain-containing protein, partial [Polyangia bacterium]|nr:glycoside hydrolase family 3 N-terminal domain-containing protein [Polyangia bacterium]